MDRRPLFDADTHYYEPEDAFTRYDEHRSGESCIRWATTDDGRRRLLIGDRVYNSIIDPTFDPVRKPGALTEMFRLLHEGRSIRGDANPLTQLIPIDPAFRKRDARLAAMDRQGVQACLMFPTVGVTVEEFMTDDPGLTYRSLRAFNRWLDDDWGFSYQDRIYGVPLLSLLDPTRAVEELDWVIDRGARVIHIRPAPTFGRSPADPVHDPFWSRVEEAGLLVTLHASESGYCNLHSRHWGEDPNPPAHLISAFQWATAFGDRPVYETIAAFILHNLFGKFPGLRVASIENGTQWVPYLLSWIDKAYEIGRHVTPPGGPLRDRPSELFHRHVYVSPHHEENLGEVVALLGADRVLMGSDWPHAEGLAEPAEYLEGLRAVDPAAEAAITWSNAASLVGV